MKGTSKVIMGATLVMVVTLAVVLGLILVLLAELYCSLLLRRRQLRNTTIPNSSTTQTTTTTITNASSPSHAPHPQQQHSPPFPPLNSIYSQGVLQAPRSLLFPAVASTQDHMAEPNQQHHHQPSELHQVIQIQTQESNANANACPRCIGSLVSVSSPLSSFMSRAPSKPLQQDSLQGSTNSETIDKSCSGTGEHLVYISNPIYENEEGKASGVNTPFETPDTSPSRLEKSGSSGEDDNDYDDDEACPCGVHSPPCTTPPLTPMKKLPAEACSVSLRDARSLGTSGSDSHSNNALSSSSSTSPCTSPSW